MVVRFSTGSKGSKVSGDWVMVRRGRTNEGLCAYERGVCDEKTLPRSVPFRKQLRVHQAPGDSKKVIFQLGSNGRYCSGQNKKGALRCWRGSVASAERFSFRCIRGTCPRRKPAATPSAVPKKAPKKAQCFCSRLSCKGMRSKEQCAGQDAEKRKKEKTNTTTL